MNSWFKALWQQSTLLLLLVSLLCFGATVVQAVAASRIATETIDAYAPKIEGQAVAVIVEALPNDEKGKQAAALAKALASNVESQYVALSRAVERQASALVKQVLLWSAACILALLVHLESRRRLASAA